MIVVKRWPMHPRPYRDQNLYSWIITLSKTYKVGFEYFCKHVLTLTQEEIFDLHSKLPSRALTILSEGTGVSIDELRQRDFNKCFQFLCFHLIKVEFVRGVLCFVSGYSSKIVLLEMQELSEEEYALISEYASSCIYAKKIGMKRGSFVEQYGLTR